MKYVTLVLPYYENPSMLRHQLDAWWEYPDKLRQRLAVIVVDDGSPRHPALDVIRAYPAARRRGLDFRLYRCLVDVRWNWLFCRNLGMAEASTAWALMTDMDHVLPPATLAELVRGEHDGRCAYRFARRDAPGLAPYKPHPNSWFLRRKLFFRIGGYDERFSGFYGTDAEFRDRVTAAARAVVMLKSFLVRYPRDVIADASTTHYGRKEPQDHVNVARIRAEREASPGWRPKNLTFPWERLI